MKEDPADELKPASLYRELKGKLPREQEIPPHGGEHMGALRPERKLGDWAPCGYSAGDICQPSIEALKLGLRKEYLSCSGGQPTGCGIFKHMAAGGTVAELYQEAKT